MNTTPTNHPIATNVENPITWADVVTGAKAKRMDAFTHEIVAEITAARDPITLFTALANTPIAGLLIKTAGNDNHFLIHNPSLAKGSRLIGDVGREFPFVLEGTDSKEATAYSIIPDQFFAMTTPRGHMNYSDLLNIQDLSSFVAVEETGTGTRNTPNISTRNVTFVPAFILEALLAKSERKTAVEMAIIAAATIKDRLLANATAIEIPDGADPENDDPFEIEQNEHTIADPAAPARDRLASDEEFIAVGGQVLVWLKYFMMEGVLSEVVLLAAPRRSTIGEAAKMLHLQHFLQGKTIFASLSNQHSQDPQPNEFMTIMPLQSNVYSDICKVRKKRV